MAKIELELFDADPFVLLAGTILQRAILDRDRGDSWRDSRMSSFKGDLRHVPVGPQTDKPWTNRGQTVVTL